jgi:hypothetical protein
MYGSGMSVYGRRRGDVCLLDHAGCTAAEMAANDIAQWQTTAAALLPGFDGTVEFTVGTPNVYVITVTWTEPDSGISSFYALTVYT